MLLQAAPEIPSVETLSNTAIDLAKATSDYGALQMVFGIFMVFILLVLISFFWQIYSTTRKVETIAARTQKIAEYFDGVSEHTLGVPAANVLVRREMVHWSALIKYQIIRIRVENHIDNIEQVKGKVVRMVENNFVELQTFLSNYTVNGKKLSSVIDPKDKQAMIDLMIDQIYTTNENFQIYSMDQTVDIFITGIKNIYLEKI